MQFFQLFSTQRVQIKTWVSFANFLFAFANLTIDVWIAIPIRLSANPMVDRKITDSAESFVWGPQGFKVMVLQKYQDQNFALVTARKTTFVVLLFRREYFLWPKKSTFLLLSYLLQLVKFILMGWKYFQLLAPQVHHPKNLIL